MSENIIIVDSNDTILGDKQRSLLRVDALYRVSALWLFDSQKRILLARRSPLKARHPRKWGPSVAGTNAAGETYEENIRKEAIEEIGVNLSEIDLKIGPKEHIRGEYEYFVQWYLATIDRAEDEFLIDLHEVDQVRWFTRDEILAMHIDSPESFLQTFKKSFDLL